MKKKYILVTAEKFGYGPIATCLNVVKYLAVLKKKFGFKIVFLGSSIAKQQAEQSNFFDEIIECQTHLYSELEMHESLFLNSEIVFSSENQLGAIYAREIGHEKVFYIDNLFWMWNKIPEGLNYVTKYYISETMDSHENFDRIGQNIKNPCFVGPIREIYEEDKNEKFNCAVINYGGVESFMIDFQVIRNYFIKLTKEILSSLESVNLDKIYITGGSTIINCLKMYEGSNVEVNCFTHFELTELIKKSKICVISSGLGNFVETLYLKTKLIYLPPINYSQLLQLNYYKTLDMGFSILSWDKIGYLENIIDNLDEQRGVDMVMENVKKYIADDAESVSQYLKRELARDQSSYYNIRKDFVKKYDKNASKIIAFDIMSALFGKHRDVPNNSFIGTYYIGNEELENVRKVIESKSLFRYDGPNMQHFTDEFEKALMEKFNVKYALACTNGAAALKLACIANGIGNGDEVIMSPFTFIATAASVLSCGGIPVFAEIDESMSIDPDSIEILITEKTKAIICVHLQGQSCEMDKIMAIAKKHSLIVIEDSAQGMGACYDRKYCGCIGDCGAFSLQAGKTITSGEGGVFVTNNKDMYIKAKMYCDNGGYRTGCDYPTWMNGLTTFGENFKISELQSAVALAQFNKLDDIALRQKKVYRFFEKFILSSDYYKLRRTPEKCSNVPFSVCVIFESKYVNELFMDFMQNRGIPFKRYCSNLIYDFDVFTRIQGWHESNYPYNLSERTYGKSQRAENIIACAAWLNLSAYITDEDIEYIIKAMDEFKTIYMSFR